MSRTDRENQTKFDAAQNSPEGQAIMATYRAAMKAAREQEKTDRANGISQFKAYATFEASEGAAINAMKNGISKLAGLTK